MLNSGKKFALCATKKINIITLVMSEKKILNETKNHNPLQIKWSVPKVIPLLQKYQQKIITHNGDNYTNKFYNMIYLDDNNKVSIKKNKVK